MSGLLSALAMQLAGTGGGTTPTPDPRPTPADATIAAMRPTGRRIGLLTVGAGRDHATLGAAISAATAIQTARMSAEGATTLTPNYRVDILVYPGTYVETVTAQPWQAFYGMGPGCLVTHTIPPGTTSTTLATVSTTGGVWWEGIDVRLVRQVGEESSWPKYPIHHVGQWTNVFAACTLDAAYTGTTTSRYTPIGMDGHGAGTTLLYQVTMSSASGPTNMHGELGAGATAPETMMYVGCTSPSTLNYAALAANDAIANHLWVVGCAAGSVSLSGSASTLHLSGSAISGSVTAPTQDTRSDWPVPTGGLSATDRAYFGMG